MKVRRRKPPDPIADYIDWANNRYNPGYYLGGNLPPFLRKTRLGPRARKLAGFPLAVTAVMNAGVTALMLRDLPLDRMAVVMAVVTFALCSLFGWAALSMWGFTGRRRSQ